MIMAESHSSTHQLPSLTAFILLLLLLTAAASGGGAQGRGRGRSSTEFSAESIDPAAIDLTALVNTLLNSSQSGSRQLFSLLSVTSYSALDLHKLTLLVYNVSGLGSFSSSWSGRRFCYCVTNRTNDLTDFTALLLDVMGNSTSYVHELFKSASILTVSQRNQSSCTYICVMAGRTGAAVPELWQLHPITPIFNRTIVEGRRPAPETQQPTHRSRVSPAETATTTGNSWELTPQPRPEAPTRDPSPGLQPATRGPTRQQRGTEEASTSGTGRAATQPAPARTTLPSMLLRKPGCPWRPPDRTGDPAAVVAMTTVGADRLPPCVLELCSFFSRCLCGRFRQKRSCVKGHRWYRKHRSEVCRRVRRIPLSRNLKQRCLTKMCKDL